MVYSSPPTFIPPPGASLLQRYRGRIIFCFLLTLAAAFAWVYLEVKPGYLAEAEYRLIPVQPESPLLRHPASEQPLSLQVALLSEETLASDALLDKSPYLAIQPGGPGGRIKISCLGEVETKAKELLETASKQLQATHAAGQQERREVLAKQLQAALADLERRQAPLKLESITHLNNLKIPEAAQAEILAAGLDSQAVTDRLAAYRASYAAMKTGLAEALQKETEALAEINTKLNDPGQQVIRARETILVQTQQGRELHRELARLEKELRGYLRTSTELHPFVKNTRQEIALVKKKLQAVGCEEKIIETVSPNPDIAVWEEQAAGHQQAIAALRQKLAAMEQEYSKWDFYAANAPLRLALAGRQQQFEVERERLATPLALLNQSDPPSWSILDRSSEPAITALNLQPDYPKAVIYGVLAGVLLSYLIVKLSEHRDHTIRDAYDATQYFTTPVLAAIPRADPRGVVVTAPAVPSRPENALKMFLILAIVITASALVVSQYDDLKQLPQQIWEKIDHALSAADQENQPNEVVSGSQETPPEALLFGALPPPLEEDRP